MVEHPRTRWPVFRTGICLALAIFTVEGALQSSGHAKGKSRSSNTLGAAAPLGSHLDARIQRAEISCAAYTATAGSNVEVPSGCAAPEKLPQGETCELTCAAGYHNVGASTALSCASNAVGDAPPSTSISCVETTCLEIAFPAGLTADDSTSISECTPADGKLSGLTAVTTPSCAVKCNPGYEATDGSTAGTISCTDAGSGYIASASLECEPKQCSAPLPGIGAGYKTSCSAMETDDPTCTQECADGYKLKSGLTAMVR